MKEEDDCCYGSLGVLSKEEEYWEDLVYMCKECSALEAIGKLRRAFEAKYFGTDKSEIHECRQD